MPEHISFLHYLLHAFGFGENAHILGDSASGHHLGYRSFEALFMGLLVMLLIMYFAWEVRGTYRTLKVSTVPEDQLTQRTFFEVFFEYFYNMAKEMMGAKNAKRYFPIIGGSAIFIFISNAVGLIPGFLPPTSNLNITAGCALAVFISFNVYGIRDNGKHYLQHMAGWDVFPELWKKIPLALLIFPIELISTCVRPVTLAIRLMLNIAVDHLLVSIMLGLFALFLPLPVMLLGVIVICVQTLVFCLLTSIYIALATEHAEEHH